MKLLKTCIVATMALTITACSVLKKGKKSATPPAPSSPSATTTPAIPGLPPPVRSKDGIFAPGNDELAAIREKYKDVTMQTLNDGYATYTGVCTNCHGTKSIYMRPESMWPDIIESMAREAKISDAQKDAVLKYVLAIKATQPK